MDVIDVSCTLEYAIDAATSFVFTVASAQTGHQTVRREQLETTPAVPYRWCELAETGYRSVRLRAPPGSLLLEYRASVEIRAEIDAAPMLDEVEHKALPDHVLTYLNPSRYCEGDRLGRFAAKEFGKLAPGYSRVMAICDWVNARVDYVAGSTDASSSACDVLTWRAGVCRDFAHVAIALCRSLGIPARYVAGYAAELEPPDFHGCFEAFLDEKWYLFDATRMAPINGFVRVAVGRDAADASFATLVGSARLQSLTVGAAREKPAQQAPDELAAISTA